MKSDMRDAMRYAGKTRQNCVMQYTAHKAITLILLALTFGCDTTVTNHADETSPSTMESTGSMTPLPDRPSPEEARADLNGVDRDGDEVRDDVQISLRELELTEEREEASLQLARGIRAAIQVGANPEASPDEVTRAGERLTRAADCLFVQFGAQATQQARLLNLLMADTPERTQGYQNFERRTSGQSFVGASRLEEACDFEATP